MGASCAWFPFASNRKQNPPNHNPCTSPLGAFQKTPPFMLVWCQFVPAQESILLMREMGMKGMHQSEDGKHRFLYNLPYTCCPPCVQLQGLNFTHFLSPKKQDAQR
ncbi:hypothetical protein OIU79_010023 [Salix purpurea]|uniref:Uncharacterized protein n=1 Tax=Salix purpurea TaxID=77065 RepID=A0A9Q0QF60_SALPP|nr:hypothetical protein OIU79_010023 [Salix purpurea]